jgi:hypothetical protein
MGMIDDADSIKAKAQERVGSEPVLAVGVLQPAGTWGSFGVGRLSPLAGVLKQKSANQAAGELNTKGAVFKSNRQTLVALTADTIYAFETKVGWGGMKILDQLAEWKRSDVAVQITPGKVADRIAFDHAPTGGHYELEATTIGTKGFHEPFLAELARSG